MTDTMTFAQLFMLIHVPQLLHDHMAYQVSRLSSLCGNSEYTNEKSLVELKTLQKPSLQTATLEKKWQKGRPE